MKEPLRPQLCLGFGTVIHHVHYILAALLFFSIHTKPANRIIVQLLESPVSWHFPWVTGRNTLQ